ncbi:AMP-binding protein [Pandoraea sp. SD6-2]|uniref:non-ribosomal peptide synthetase n=1 Tax=Pandoraea sp. SD6-2 TaxID=1286093 RepID=UPI0003A762DF|nr:AMP-binding protein [Pandoraea sp. SD6-2]
MSHASISEEYWSHSESIVEQVWEAAKADPQRIVIEGQGKRISCAALTRGALLLAARMQRDGVGQGDYILCPIERDLALPLAWLTCASTGAVLVPVDRGWPSERLEYVRMLTRARGEFCLTDTHTLTRGELPAFQVDISDDQIVDGASLLTPCNAPNPGALLYGFFTSGSTGTPKCALNRHRGVANRLSYMTKTFGRGHRVLQNSAHLFDSSIWQILWPLCSQGTLFIDSDHRPADVCRTADLIARHGITMTDFVPSLFRLLVIALRRGEISRDSLRSLRYLIIGGEELDAVSVREFMELLPDVQLVNTYGHTEASIGMVFHFVSGDPGDRIPLGKPIDNTFVRICDEMLRPLPDGQLGEIVVGGECVGAGYLGQSELTETAFPLNPFADVPGERVYRTGDMGSINALGLLEYHGRFDDQVKVRGVRVELGEIECTARKAFGGKADFHAFSFCRDHGEPSVGLAYSTAQTVTVDEIWKALKRGLPATHLPAVILCLESVPRTATGKVDKKQIARMFAESAANDLDGADVDTLEGLLLGAFKRWFGAASVSADSNFFELGGDSLEAVHFLVDVERKLGIKLPLQTLYDHPSARMLARYVEAPATSVPADVEFEPVPEFSPIRRVVRAPRQRHIVLTGSSGFLGIHTLATLLTQTTAHVTAMVRAQSREDAWTRLAREIACAGINLESLQHRVEALPSDLSRRSFGWDAPTWQRIAVKTDTVIHAGANVNFLSSYRALRAANVIGTQQVIDLCSEDTPKRLVYVSSMVAERADSVLGTGEICHVPVGALTRDGLNGYATTKIVSEQLVLAAARSGLDAAILRLGDVLPSVRTGHGNRKSVILRFFRYCHEHRIAPLDVGDVVGVSVDVAAQTLVARAVAECRDGNASLGAAWIDGMAETAFSIDMIFRTAEHMMNLSYEFVGYQRFLKTLRESRGEDARILLAVLPPPSAINEIFGRSPPECFSARPSAYFQIALALLGSDINVEERNNENGLSAWQQNPA